MRNFTVKGIVTAARTRFEDLLNCGQIAQQAAAAVAVDDALRRAAEIEIDEIEAGVLADARAVGECLGVGAEELRGDGMLVVVVREVALALGLAHAAEAVGGGELGHDEAAAGDLVRWSRRRRRCGALARVAEYGAAAEYKLTRS